MAPTLGDYRRRLAETAGWFLQTQTTAGSAQAQQLVISDFQSTELETTFFGNTWAYQPSGPNAGQARRFSYGSGLDPVTGILTLDRPFGSLTPIATTIEVYGKLPPISMEGRLGLNAIVNRVLAECWTIKHCDIVASSDSQRFFPINPDPPTTPAFPWLQSEDQIVDVYSRAQGLPPDQEDLLQSTWRWLPEAQNPTIETGRALNMGDLTRVLAIVPMSWWINPGTGWTIPAAPGLVADSDQGMLDLPGMEAVGKPYIYDELAKWGLSEDQATYRQLQARARAAANEWKRLSLQRPKRRTLHWPSSLVAPSRWSYSYGAGQGMVTRG